MKLSDYRETYYEFSGKASEVARKLAFAGIALVWIFKTSDAPTPKIPKELILPTGLLVLTLVFDLFQYIAATAIWGVFQWYEERKLSDINDDPELSTPPCLKWPQNTFFGLKLISISMAYVLLSIFVWRVWLQ
ncbi:MAG: hypothetical protein A2075_12555 [Geobacteraceae bacterium GWC2_58_44]|nr:MAG: hypothetical protein A2075_12555 [Geobacteraceae bacterium GWC2_58_44]HBG06924.1 hypothetical protein [Geobacter sp.]